MARLEDTGLVDWLITVVTVCMQQQYIRDQVLCVDHAYQRVLGLYTRKHALHEQLFFFVPLTPRSPCAAWCGCGDRT